MGVSYGRRYTGQVKSYLASYLAVVDLGRGRKVLIELGAKKEVVVNGHVRFRRLDKRPDTSAMPGVGQLVTGIAAPPFAGHRGDEYDARLTPWGDVATPLEQRRKKRIGRTMRHDLRQRRQQVRAS